MESLITEPEPRKPWDDLEPVDYPQVVKSGWDTRSRGRTLRLIENHGAEAVRSKFLVDARTTVRNLRAFLQKIGAWNHDQMLDRKQWIASTQARIEMNLIELVAAAETITDKMEAPAGMSR